MTTTEESAARPTMTALEAREFLTIGYDSEMVAIIESAFVAEAQAEMEEKAARTVTAIEHIEALKRERIVAEMKTRVDALKRQNENLRRKFQMARAAQRSIAAALRELEQPSA